MSEWDVAMQLIRVVSARFPALQARVLGPVALDEALQEARVLYKVAGAFPEQLQALGYDTAQIAFNLLANARDEPKLFREAAQAGARCVETVADDDVCLAGYCHDYSANLAQVALLDSDRALMEKALALARIAVDRSDLESPSLGLRRAHLSRMLSAVGSGP